MTALKQLIKNLEIERKKETDNGFRNVYSHIIDSAKVLLEKEKQQIVHAYELGCIEEMKETFKTGKEFYESIYENPNE